MHKYGELVVGDAVVIETADQDFPYLIAAPTMRCPMNVAKSANAYLAFRAVLIAIKEYSGVIKSVLCPGLATAVGEMPAFNSARQMYEAYKSIWLDQPMKLKESDWIQTVWQQHKEMNGWDK